MVKENVNQVVSLVYPDVIPLWKFLLRTLGIVLLLFGSQFVNK